MCLAVIAKIKSIHNDTAVADFGSVTREISLGILEGVKKGDYVLVHAGFAIGIRAKDEAEDTIRLLQEMRNAACN